MYYFQAYHEILLTKGTIIYFFFQGADVASGNGLCIFPRMNGLSQVFFH